MEKQRHDAQLAAFVSVMKERDRQHELWGEQQHSLSEWHTLLSEEVGELAQAINETVLVNRTKEKDKGGYDNMRAEAVQVAALAVQFVEYLDRHYKQEEKQS
ncbi:hypothetical protein [Domibacillus enclensis]|uniref:Uncharacterized protein n=1 Tax=Domibacillus enclensis TaxID=1017273 RepID=A0A1N6WGQ5_9BACI|nr:hypothetical protein [Domibacillus enclensis]OXS77928.1 hypothetical protein B1B05_10000 [Domibacillus enclensis]SIQ89241.1 hypothetical protein SAMN05443094_104160 [Domibacillus enclensis]